MARDVRGIIDAIFADTGDVADPTFDFAEGWPVAYSQAGGQTPEREVFNRLFQALYALGYDVTRFGGALPWDVTINYTTLAMVVGADGKIYMAMQPSLGVNPTQDTGDNWRDIIADHTHAQYADPNNSYVWQRAQRYTQSALAINAGAVAWDMAAQPLAVLTLTGNVTSWTMTNLAVGGSYRLALRQDANGNHSVAWPANLVLWPDGQVLDVTQGAHAEDAVEFTAIEVDGTVKLRATYQQNFAVVA